MDCLYGVAHEPVGSGGMSVVHVLTARVLMYDTAVPLRERWLIGSGTFRNDAGDGRVVGGAEVRERVAYASAGEREEASVQVKPIRIRGRQGFLIVRR